MISEYRMRIGAHPARDLLDLVLGCLREASGMEGSRADGGGRDGVPGRSLRPR